MLLAEHSFVANPLLKDNHWPGHMANHMISVEDTTALATNHIEQPIILVPLLSTALFAIAIAWLLAWLPASYTDLE
jgi:uncharacterized membrane protein